MNKGNKYVCKGDTTEMQLSNGMVCLIDTADIKLVENFTWYAAKPESNNNWYVVTHPRGKEYRKLFTMGRFLLSPESGLVVDHINGNGLDNRRRNIRVCTYSQNQYNKRRQSTPTKNNYKGTFKERNIWRARISFQNKRIHLGQFETEIEAALAYDKKAKELFGEYACLNFREQEGK